MTYSLAKELKDAGFPYDWSLGILAVNGNVSSPTLSELIEACGDKYPLLIEWRPGFNNWRVSTHRDGQDTETYGPTPEEAVARLWLALNKKESTTLSNGN